MDVAVKNSLDEAVKNSVDEAVKISVEEAVKKSVDEAVKNSLDEAVRYSVDEAVRNSLDEAAKDFVGESVKNSVDQAVQSLEQRVADLENKMGDITKDVSFTKIKANDNEQYSRKYNLRFVGIEEEEDECCTDKVLNFCSTNLGLVLNSSVIDRAHRVGKKSTDRTRSIIVKFGSYGAKMSVVKRRKELKDTDYYINEDLTKYNLELLTFARLEAEGVKSVWASDGKIFVKDSNDKIFRILKMEDFEKFKLI